MSIFNKDDSNCFIPTGDSLVKYVQDKAANLIDCKKLDNRVKGILPLELAAIISVEKIETLQKHYQEMANRPETPIDSAEQFEQQIINLGELKNLLEDAYSNAKEMVNALRCE